jgi:type II secretory pathway component GspD/PulD (secretin)
MKSVKKFLLVLMCMFLVGCVDAARVNVSKKEAIEDFINRSDKITEDFSNTQLPPAPARTLVQFTYGPSSLKNFGFLEYLVESKANLSSDIIKQLKEEENNYLLSLDDQSSSNFKISKRLEQYKKDLKTYKKLSEQTFVTFNNQSMISGLTELSKRADLIASFPEESSLKEKGYLRGQYSGSLLEVMEKITSDFKLKLSFKPDMKTIVFSNENVSGNIKLSADKIKDTFAVANDSKKINEIIAKISKKNDELSDEEIKSFMAEVDSKSAQSFVRNLLYQINQEQVYKKKNADLSSLRKLIIAYSESASKDSVKTVATFKSDMKNGSEKVIEKFSVFNDTPESMYKILNNYSVFKEKCVQKLDKNGNQLPTNSPKSIQQNVINQNLSLNTDQANLKNANSNLDQFNKPNLLDVNKVEPDKKEDQNKNPSGLKASELLKNEEQSEKLITESDPSFVSAELTGCVVFSKDSTGVLVAGTVVEAALAARFIADQDKPVKQAMLEVYIMEVTTDWQSKIQSNIAKQFKGGGGISSTNIPLSTTTLANQGILNFTNIANPTKGINFSTINSNKLNIQALINVIEINSIGRNISNPVILVKDGETGTVSKLKTIRDQLATGGVANSSGTVTAGGNRIESVDVPLKLDIKADINKHNDNIELSFNYKETTLLDDAKTSSSLTASTVENSIVSKLIAQPGQIIVMAGLKKETNSKGISGIPGITNLGPLSAIASWFGGSQSASSSGSELLVFIKPTVITNLNSDKIINQVNY